MLKKILDCYRPNARLNRTEFIFSWALFVLLAYALFLVFSSIVSIEIYPVKYLIGKSILELILYLVMIPICMARLRDITWPTYIAYGVIPVWLFTTRNLIIYMHLNDIEAFQSVIMFYVELTLAIMFLFILICIFLVKSNSNQILQHETHKY